jgi:hypothetical protein
MPGWKFSFITAIGTGGITITGIGREVTTGPGETSDIPGCPMHFEIYRRIFAARFDIINEFDMRTFISTGGHGKNKSTGTDALNDARCERSVMMRK